MEGAIYAVGLMTIGLVGIMIVFVVIGFFWRLIDATRHHEEVLAERDYWKKQFKEENQRVADLREKLQGMTPFRGEVG